MSKSAKKTSLTNSNEEIEDVLSSEIVGGLQLDDDFVLIEKVSKVIPHEDHLNSRLETHTEFINVTEHGTNPEINRSSDDFWPEHYAVDLECKIKTSPEWDKGLVVEQQYLDQYESTIKRVSSPRTKHFASRRLTIKEIEKIAREKESNRDPSYYKFDLSTTATLKTLFEKRYAGPYHNIVWSGTSSVVIHAHCPNATKIYRFNYYHEIAVKIHRLTNDVKKNNAILKRVQREYEHLHMLRYNSPVPNVERMMRNVITMRFIGNDQEPAMSISSLPGEHLQNLYQTIVKQMQIWYKKFNLVHGKLCAQNILFEFVSDNFYKMKYRPFIIGWSHSVRANHPRALVKLLRDCHFVATFFKRRNIPAKSMEELFKDITELDEISSKLLDAIHKKDLWQSQILTNPNRGS